LVFVLQEGIFISIPGGVNNSIEDFQSMFSICTNLSPYPKLSISWILFRQLEPFSQIDPLFVEIK